MGKYNRMGWAWFGATLGGFLGEGAVELLLSGVPAQAAGFVVGAFLGILAGEALTNASVAAGVKGMILGTKHAIAASTGGYVGLLLAQNVRMSSYTVFPDLTVAAIVALVGVLLAELLF